MELDRLGALHLQAVWMLLAASNFLNFLGVCSFSPDLPFPAQCLLECSCWTEAEPSGTIQETRAHANTCSRSLCGELSIEVLEGLKIKHEMER